MALCLLSLIIGTTIANIIVDLFYDVAIVAIIPVISDICLLKLYIEPKRIMYVFRITLYKGKRHLDTSITATKFYHITIKIECKLKRAY